MEVIATKDIEAMTSEIRHSLMEPVEFGTVAEIRQLLAMIRQNYELKQRILQRSYRDHASELVQLKQELSTLELDNVGSESEYETKKRALLAEQEAIGAEISFAEKELETYDTEIEDHKLKLEMEQYWEKRESFTVKKLQLMREELGLYLTISALKWDFNAPNPSGTIYLPDDVKIFQQDPSKPQFEATNELWRMLSE